MPAAQIEYLVGACRQVSCPTHSLDDVIAYQNRGIPQLLARSIHRDQSVNVFQEQRGHDRSPGNTMLRTRAHRPPVAIPEDNVFLRRGGSAWSSSGTKVTPSPSPREIARMMELRRFMDTRARIRTPDAATIPNMIRVAPPNAAG